MKRLAILITIVIALPMLGANCDSGDYTDSYIYCSTDCVDASGNCYTQQSQCPQSATAGSGTGSCTTGLHTFLNGNNECNAMQSNSLNNDCPNTDPGVLAQMTVSFTNIGCNGIYAATP